MSIATRSIKYFIAGIVLVTSVAHANQFQVTKGTSANIGDYPFYVSVQLRASENGTYSSHSCGGTVVAPGWVLTAAHCSDKADFVVTTTGKKVKVTSNTRNPDYSESSGVIGSDTALLQLEENADIAPVILGKPDFGKNAMLVGRGAQSDPVAYADSVLGVVPSNNLSEWAFYHTTALTGWPTPTTPQNLIRLMLAADGSATPEQSGGFFAIATAARDAATLPANPTFDEVFSALQSVGFKVNQMAQIVQNAMIVPTDAPLEAQITLALQNTCKALWNGQIDTSNFICSGKAASAQLNSSPCYGDSGGPLLQKNSRGEWVQIGVVSRGQYSTCGVGLDAYARTDTLSDFFNDTIGLEWYAERIFAYAEAKYSLPTAKTQNITLDDVDFRVREYPTLWIGISTDDILLYVPGTGLINDLKLKPKEVLKEAKSTGF